MRTWAGGCEGILGAGRHCAVKGLWPEFLLGSFNDPQASLASMYAYEYGPGFSDRDCSLSNIFHGGF
jgi:hypothetical protein